MSLKGRSLGAQEERALRLRALRSRRRGRGRGRPGSRHQNGAPHDQALAQFLQRGVGLVELALDDRAPASPCPTVTRSIISFISAGLPVTEPTIWQPVKANIGNGMEKVPPNRPTIDQPSAAAERAHAELRRGLGADEIDRRADAGAAGQLHDLLARFLVARIEGGARRRSRARACACSRRCRPRSARGPAPTWRSARPSGRRRPRRSPGSACRHRGRPPS